MVQPIVAGLGDLVPVTLQVGQERSFTEVVRALSDAAYARVDMVTHRGEFAVRGGILDVFPPTEDHPIRVEFFGDEVDQMRWFAVADQRSLSAPGIHHPHRTARTAMPGNPDHRFRDVPGGQAQSRHACRG